MSNRPEYPVASPLERAAHAVLAAVTGVGLLIAVVTAFQSQLPEPSLAQGSVARAMCYRVSSDPSRCLVDVASR